MTTYGPSTTLANKAIEPTALRAAAHSQRSALTRMEGRDWRDGVSAPIGLQLTHRKEGTMDSIWRAVVLGVVVTLGVVLGAGLVRVSAQASDPRIGTWKLNVEKSKYSPGPAPQSKTMKIEASGEGEKATTEGVNAAGTATRTQYTAQFRRQGLSDYGVPECRHGGPQAHRCTDPGTHGQKGR